MTRVLEASVEDWKKQRILELTKKIFSSSGIETRHGVITDFFRDDPSTFDFFPANWELEPFPSTEERMRVYEQASVELVVEASQKALGEADVEPDEITHLVVCTCTGFFAPGPDVRLVKRLGIRPTVKRTIIGFMGCYAGFNGIRMADQIIRSDPEALVLQVCVELCSLHFQKKPEPDLIVANCLFADGCVAAVYGASARHEAGLADLVAHRSFVETAALDQMAWNIGNHGFEMRLSTRVPRTLEVTTPDFVSSLLDVAGLSRGQVVNWAVHPGGPKILDAVGGALGLGENAFADSSAVLRDFGNMSSATIFFILDRQVRKEENRGPTLALGFGPGLTVEGAVLSIL